MKMKLKRIAAKDWRSIETAPTDGTIVLITDGKLCRIAWWEGGDDQWMYAATPIEIDGKPGAFYCSYFDGPTHWMPEPELPQP